MGKRSHAAVRDYDLAHPELREAYGDYSIAQQLRRENFQLRRFPADQVASAIVEAKRRRAVRLP
jgi:hypothetical protein